MRLTPGDEFIAQLNPRYRLRCVVKHWLPPEETKPTIPDDLGGYLRDVFAGRRKPLRPTKKWTSLIAWVVDDGDDFNSQRGRERLIHLHEVKRKTGRRYACSETGVWHELI